MVNTFLRHDGGEAKKHDPLKVRIRLRKDPRSVGRSARPGLSGGGANDESRLTLPVFDRIQARLT